MGLLDWVKDKVDIFGGGKPSQLQRSVNVVKDTAGQAQTNKTWRSPQKIEADRDREQASQGWKEKERAAALSGRLVTPEQRAVAKTTTTPEKERAAALSGKFTPDVVGPPSKAPFGGAARLTQILGEVNKTNADARDNIKTPTDMLDMDNKKGLSSYSYGMRDEDWKLVLDTFGAPDATAPEGTLSLPGMPALLQEAPKVQAEEYAAAPLTWDAYNALSSDQKAAIDANTVIVEARELDLSKKWKLDEAAQKKYDADVLRVFGEGGGSDTIAPNLMKMFTDTDFTAVGQDLDEYLSLERGFTMEELEDFKIDPKAVEGLVQLGDEPDMSFDKVRAPGNVAAADQALVTKTNDVISKRMEAANFALANFDNAVLDPFFNPTAPLAAYPLGYGSPAGRTTEFDQRMEQWLQDAYLTLQTPTADVNGIFQEMDDFEFTPEERQNFFDYVDQRSRTEAQYGQAPAEGTRTGDEIRAALGIGG